MLKLQPGGCVHGPAGPSRASMPCWTTSSIYTQLSYTDKTNIYSSRLCRLCFLYQYLDSALLSFIFEKPSVLSNQRGLRVKEVSQQLSLQNSALSSRGLRIRIFGRIPIQFFSELWIRTRNRLWRKKITFIKGCRSVYFVGSKSCFFSKLNPDLYPTLEKIPLSSRVADPDILSDPNPIFLEDLDHCG